MSDLGELREDLEHGKVLSFNYEPRRYPPPAPIDIPEPELSAPQYARQIDRYIERRERLEPSLERDFIDRYPRITMAIACGTVLVVLWDISRYFRSAL